MKKLSNYTHARYCKDEADLKAGIEEVKNAIRIRIVSSEKIPYYYYVRLNKLKIKLERIQDITQTQLSHY